MIRNAVHSDLEELIILGWEMHQESSYKRMSYSPERVAESFIQFIDSDNYLFLVVEKDSRLIGGFVGFVHPQWFSDELISGDLALFVEQGMRGGVCAAQMINRFCKWAISQGVERHNIQLGITTGVKVEETTRLYEKLGFIRTGSVFNYRGD